MKLRFSQIRVAQMSIPKLLQKELSDAKAAYWIQKNARKLESEIIEIEKDRIKLVKTYGVFDAKANKWDVPDNKRVEFDRKFEELMNTEVDVEIIPISLDSLKDAKLSPMDMSSIEFMIKE